MLDDLSGAGRYLRFLGIRRATAYGCSFWDFTFFGRGTETAIVEIDPGSATASRVRALDGAGNARLNADGAVAFGAPLSPLQGWRDLHVATLDAEDPVGGDHAMPLGDGVPNLVKYALGLDPIISVKGTDLPVLERADDAFLFAFDRPRAATDVRLRVQTSADQEDWSTVWDSVDHPMPTGDADDERVLIEAALDSGDTTPGARFWRLRVDVP